MQPDIPALLHAQHRFYTAELGRTHQALSKLYRKLAKGERQLAEREQRILTRKDYKKIQWTRSVTRETVRKLEVQQAGLHEYLRQCSDLIASYDAATTRAQGAQQSAYHVSPMTPWTAPHLPPGPPSPYAMPFSPYSPVAANPWTAAPARACLGGNVGNSGQQGPQYWDLSMLRERRQSSPNALSAADSGFHEPAMYGQPFGLLEGASDANHVFAHELMSPGSTYSSSGGDDASALETRSKKLSLSSEKDDVPELLHSPVSPSAKLGADVAPGATSVGRGHKRRYSENAIQLIENRLAAPRTQQQRGTSAGPVCRGNRNGDAEDRMFGERRAEELASIEVEG
ncbi:hypothetical protein LTR36_003833 [Oleoguttula mirabilis]|uniref:Uncharacterized protein n=1 Tax=Oleoguttula mirabilis TaxID=1507867 RepID=A0AAV9JJ20_9PEZI|nr:hypothetical protein LTR36_003833 [Oleoguttula mirabilis]